MGEAARQSGRGRSLGHRPRWLLAAACAGLSWSLPAAAQDDAEAAETAAARGLAIEGIKLADAGRCADAIDKLARAEKLHHAPVVLGRLGECQVQEGKLVEGTENLRKVVREQPAPDAPPVVAKARERAAAVLERAKLRIAALHIVVRSPSDHASVLIAVDGQPMNMALLDADRPTDPGEHLVEASAPGYLATSVRVHLNAGDKQNVVINLEADPNARLAAASASTSVGPLAAGNNRSALTRDASFTAPMGSLSSSGRGTEQEQPDQTAAYIAWAAGSTAIAVGSIFGLMAFSGKSDLDKECSGNVCPESSQERLDSARSASTAATVLMALGGGGLALGTVFYFSAGPTEEGPTEEGPSETASSSAPRNSQPGLAGDRQALRARAWIGLGRVGLSGEF